MSLIPTEPVWRRSSSWLIFAPEWLFLVALVLAEIPLASWAGLHFQLSSRDANLVGIPLLATAILLRKFGARRVDLILEIFALLMLTGSALGILTYVAAVKAGPLMDATLLAMDRRMGFDWLAWFHFVMAHKVVAVPLRFLYFSLVEQILYLCVLMSIMGEVGRLREIFWLLSLSLTLTTLGSWLLPALGPFQTFGLQSYGTFLPEMARLRSGVAVTVSMHQIQGIVTFPSFHVTLGLGLIYAFRRTGIIGWMIAVADSVMMLSVPVFGGHYLVDMIAGALVFAAALAMVRTASKLYSQQTAPERQLATV